MPAGPGEIKPAHRAPDSSNVTSKATFPRALTHNEHAALIALLDHADFPGRDALRAQADDVIATGGCSCPCASIHLAPAASTPPADAAPSPISNEAHILDEGGEIVGGMILFVTEGRMSLLEVYTYADEPIAPFPALGRLRFLPGWTPGTSPGPGSPA